jgi:hypothetical protein
MKIKSITINGEFTTVAWTSEGGAEWQVTADRLIDGEFGVAMAALNQVAAQTLHHPAEEMSVRKIKLTERKKDGMEFVQLSGVLAAHSKDGKGKPGKFSTGKIQVDLLAKNEVSKVSMAAIEWAKQVGVK